MLQWRHDNTTTVTLRSLPTNGADLGGEDGSSISISGLDSACLDAGGYILL